MTLLILASLVHLFSENLPSNILPLGHEMGIPVILKRFHFHFFVLPDFFSLKTDFKRVELT